MPEQQSSNHFDISWIESNFEDDWDIFSTILEVFEQEWQGLVNSIESSLHEKNAKNLEITSHALKGAARNFGENLVASDALAIEKIAHTGSVEGCAELLSRIKLNIPEMIAALRCHFDGKLQA